MILKNNNKPSDKREFDPKWKKGAKLLDKIQTFENQAHTSQQEKVKRKTIVDSTTT